VTSAAAVRPRQGSFPLPWISLLLTAIAVAAYLALGPAPEAWIFDREAIVQGQWWRLLTGHWVHSDPQHVVWDVTALLLFGSLFEARLGWRLPLALLLATAGVDAWLWWGLPDLQRYCGLSGILNGLLAAGLFRLWYDLRHPVVLLTAGAAVLKICVEIEAGHALFTATAWASVPSAHGAGLLTGLAAASILHAAASGPSKRRFRMA
jgi:rhomboid family GlyGly-CTERM serine protease